MRARIKLISEALVFPLLWVTLVATIIAAIMNWPHTT